MGGVLPCIYAVEKNINIISVIKRYIKKVQKLIQNGNFYALNVIGIKIIMNIILILIIASLISAYLIWINWTEKI